MAPSEKACSNASAPIDIANVENLDMCNAKCSLSCQYANADLNIINRTKFLLLTEINTPTTSGEVMFNQKNYSIGEVRLYSPSLHTFNGKNADMELIIIHNQVIGKTPQTTLPQLLICIPVSGDGTKKTTASKALENIITNASKKAPHTDGTTSLNNVDFTFNDFIPLKPYIYYTGTLPYPPCMPPHKTNISYVVFTDPESISISSETYSLLKGDTGIISPTNYKTVPIPASQDRGPFYNSKGPSLKKKGEDDIYIVCNPTGSSGETMVVEPTNPSSIWGMSLLDKLINSGIISGMLGFIVFYIIYKFSMRFFRSMGPSSSVKLD